jgi:hypothetical protein
MRPLGLILALVLLAGCAAPVIQIPMGAAAVAWGEGRATYATVRAIAIQLRKEGKIDDAGWEAMKAEDIKAKVLKEFIEKALLNPVEPIDYAKIMAYTTGALELMMRVGLVP